MWRVFALPVSVRAYLFPPHWWSHTDGSCPGRHGPRPEVAVKQAELILQHMGKKARHGWPITLTPRESLATLQVIHCGDAGMGQARLTVCRSLLEKAPCGWEQRSCVHQNPMLEVARCLAQRLQELRVSSFLDISGWTGVSSLESDIWTFGHFLPDRLSIAMFRSWIFAFPWGFACISAKIEKSHRQLCP
jgi:hypothetical protein